LSVTARFFSDSGRTTGNRVDSARAALASTVIGRLLSSPLFAAPRLRVIAKGELEDQRMTNTTLMIVAIVVVLAVAALVWIYIERRRNQRLRARFGPEYDRTVQAVGPARAATVLADREKRVSAYKIRKLNQEESTRFSDAWRRVQAKFVDDPAGAVTEADLLVTEVMTTRGYPMSDFDRRAEDLSVDHGQVVKHYRAARDIAARHAQRTASTEDLRQALVHYRALFADLLEEQPRDGVRRSA
jgi:hypothetical protein